MKARSLVASARVGLALAAILVGSARAEQTADDPGWPRVFEKGGNQLTVHQPQVDYWKNYTYLHFRCAISVKTPQPKKEAFGVVEIDAATVVDHAVRTVMFTPTRREFRFPNLPDADVAALRAIVDELKPMSDVTTLSLDRVLAYVNPDEQPQQRAVEVDLAPPKIFFSSQPAILVMFLGEPQLKPVEKGRTDLLFALNTNWDLFYDTASQRYFLLNQDNWLTASEAKGPWTATQKLPASLSSLPADDNWADVRKNLATKRSKTVPTVFVSTQPAELILAEGEPSYRPIKGTRLMSVANTDSVVFLNTGDASFYFLVAGRWFRAASLDGAWSAASKDLPPEFTKIPDDDPAAFVKASVPGTQEAKDAVLLASVPSTTTVYTTNVTVQVIYQGQPKFKPIEGTVVQYAINTPKSVFLVNGTYYCCDQGVWFNSGAAAGPWAFCTSVPAAIYTIPPSSPLHNVTYVVVQSSTPTTVVYSQTAGYSGEYVAASGVVMFGAGIVLGAIIANSDDHYYYPPPIHYSYGCGAVYHHGYGGYYSASHVAYGPYGGASRSAAYNPATGTYARGATVYGPAGSASVKQAYNPYTGGYAQSARVSTATGSAGRFAATQGGEAVWGGYRTSAYGSAAGVRTSEGSGMAAWNTQNSQGAVAKSASGNYYAAKDGTVYKRESAGNWSQNSGSGWNSVDKPAPTKAAPSATTTRSPSAAPTSAPSRESTKNMESQAQSRERGNRQSSSAQSWRSSASGTGGRSSGGSRSSGGVRSSGGGRGRR